MTHTVGLERFEVSRTPYTVKIGPYCKKNNIIITIGQMFEEDGSLSFVTYAPLADHLYLGLGQVDKPQPSLKDQSSCSLCIEIRTKLKAWWWHKE